MAAYQPKPIKRKKKPTHISQLKQSKFLTRADVGKGALVTIREIIQENVAMEGSEPDMKFCLVFDEKEKPMVLNSTNGQIIAAITGSEDTDDWTGKKIVLYDDPTVSFGGKLVGGIRCRAPRPPAGVPASAGTHGMLGKPVHRPATAPAPANPASEVAEQAPLPADDDSSVPF
jgi:hypothetical protein